MAARGMGNNTDLVYEYFVSQDVKPNPFLQISNSAIAYFQVSAVDAMAFANGKSPIRWEEVWKHLWYPTRQAHDNPL